MPTLAKCELCQNIVSLSFGEKERDYYGENIYYVNCPTCQTEGQIYWPQNPDEGDNVPRLGRSMKYKKFRAQQKRWEQAQLESISNPPPPTTVVDDDDIEF